ncbi:hypothetical protein [Haliangium sp.]|uniref:hypothetical protein n=1 Tax=Haliangium sp. TaxID=2663208 RepID=UPI003D0C7AB6
MNHTKDDSSDVVLPSSRAIHTAAPLVWVEAERVFITRGHLYDVRADVFGSDSDLVLERRDGGARCIVLSSRTPGASPMPATWSGVEALSGIAIGTRLGDAIVLRAHGGNEYTVAHLSACLDGVDIP